MKIRTAFETAWIPSVVDTHMYVQVQVVNSNIFTVLSLEIVIVPFVGIFFTFFFLNEFSFKRRPRRNSEERIHNLNQDNVRQNGIIKEGEIKK